MKNKKQKEKKKKNNKEQKKRKGLHKCVCQFEYHSVPIASCSMEFVQAAPFHFIVSLEKYPKKLFNLKTFSTVSELNLKISVVVFLIFIFLR